MANELVIRNGIVSKGDVTLPISVQDNNYTVRDDDYSIVLSGSSDLTVTIPSSATTLTGKVFVFKGSVKVTRKVWSNSTNHFSV